MPESVQFGLKAVNMQPALCQSARKAAFRLMERAKENGILLTFDPNLRPALRESEETMKQVGSEIASRSDFFLPGIGECRILSGKETPEEFFDFYEGSGARTVIIKNGPQRACVREDGQILQIPGFPADKAIDTVGAGDGFAVGVLSGLLGHCRCLNAYGAAMQSDPFRSPASRTTKLCPGGMNWMPA